MRRRTIRNAVRVASFTAVCLVFLFGLLTVFGQFRFEPRVAYQAVFTNVSGLKGGNFVRIAGVEVGKVTNLSLDRDGSVTVGFALDKSLTLTAATKAAVRYENLVGDRYLALENGPGSGERLTAGATIPLQRTSPALDVDALIGGFRPLFQSLSPEKVNTISKSIITIFQGQGGTINDILDQTAQLTQSIADRDQAIGEVIKNLNIVLDTTVAHQQQFNDTLKNFETLITGLKNRADPIGSSVANISNAAGSLADLLSDNRPLLKDTVGRLEVIQQPLIDQKQQLNDILVQFPQALKIIGRAGGIYGDFFNFYACDLSLKLNGLQPGGPVRTVRLSSQPSGRCTPR